MSTVFPSLPYPTWLDSGKLSQLGMRVPFREVLLTIEHSDWSVTCNLCRDPPSNERSLAGASALWLVNPANNTHQVLCIGSVGKARVNLSHIVTVFPPSNRFHMI